MSENTAAARDAKRRARYRGNPERARFQRQPDSEQFMITTTDCTHTAHSSQELVQQLRHVSLVDDSPTTPVEAETSAYASLINCMPLPEVALESEFSDGEPLADEEEGIEPAELFPPLEDTLPGDRSDSELAEQLTPPVEENKPSARRRQQPRKTSNPSASDDKPKGAPTRFTRSMARKIGGIQPPRRHFGEGVSESQILY
ncbi:hypothetical protein GGI19_000639 [Coemansia pectinata]|uniref:Uncharacterized protein n=1 Tax=Coemansia pectinata TaxID=1052879 RepID=A0A9W8H6D1_9FUNG|nr:hypothetical protein GGI19_000639 [Coemansia pectinata]